MEECKGCFTRLLCKRIKRYESYNCPCKICLLKMICNVPCEEYDTFWGHEEVGELEIL